VGLVHGHWFFWVVWFVRLRVYHSGIVVLRDVRSVGVGLGCVVRVQRPSDGSCGLKRGCGPKPPPSSIVMQGLLFWAVSHEVPWLAASVAQSPIHAQLPRASI
jgi:hypothetical protein